MANNNKHTGPNVPSLRFPEFSGEWKSIKLGDVLKLKGGYAFKSEKFQDSGVPVVRISNLPQNSYSVDLSDCVYYESGNYQNYTVKNGDLLIAMSGATTGKTAIYRYDYPAYLNQRVGLFAPKELVHNQFLYPIVESKTFISQLGSKLVAGAQPNISSQDIETIAVGLPSKEEQIKIAHLFELLNQKIETQSKIIEELTTLRSALHQGIMSTGLKDGSWRMQTLAEVLSERTELNNEGHAVHSVSVSKGIVNQIEYLGRSFDAKDTSRYHVAYPGDVVYTKSPTGEFPYGIVKQSQIPIKAAISPLYGVYVPITQEIGYIIHNHFLSAKNALNYLHPLIQKGAKNTINITNQRFLQNSMPLPSSNSVARLYFKTIKTLSDKIELEISILHQLQIQKRKLLNDMFI